MTKKEPWEISLDIAREQVILAIMIRGVFSAGAGSFESKLLNVSKGPWSFGKEEMDSIDRHRASWGLEVISIQNLAVALDTIHEQTFANRLQHENPVQRDYFCFVRCLRNAFTHNPYDPTWVLKGKAYRRSYELPENWVIDLSSRNETPVRPSDYRHAGGLIRLVKWGISYVKKEKQSKSV